jgi:tetratricopeptide (TPR) repeat protein
VNSFNALTLLFAFVIIGAAQSEAKTVRDVIKSIEKDENKIPLYKSQEREKTRNRVNVKVGKPISNLSSIFPDGTVESQYEEKLNQEIRQLHKLSNKLNDGETKRRIILKLAKAYSEKAALAERKAQDNFEKQLKLYLAGSIKTKPVAESSESRRFSLKSIEMYRKYLANYKNTRGTDEVLFFLGYNYMSLGNVREGVSYYKMLSDRYPKSEYVNDANLSLADYYFDRDQRSQAKKYYEKIIAEGRNTSAFVLATYKLAWLNRKMGDHDQALKNILKVIRLGKGGVRNRKSILLSQEAKKDLPLFYADSGDPRRAVVYFTNIMPTDEAYKGLENLAYIYVDSGQKAEAKYLFGQLVELKPDGDRSFDYQYALVNMQASTGREDLYERELYKWVQQFGPDSKWAREAKNDKKKQEAMEKAEVALRSHVLKLHNRFREKKNEVLALRAKKGYSLYMDTFLKSPYFAELQFYNAELLYEMGEYQEAYKAYKEVKDSKYKAKSELNAVLALEKIIPSDKEVRERVGKSTDEYPLSPAEKDFVKAANAYLEDTTNREKRLEIKYRLASMYYSHNYFDKSEVLFKEIIKESPNSEYARYASDLIIDSYKLKNDYVGLEKAGNELLALGSSSESTKVEVSKVKSIVEQSAFKKIEDMNTDQNPEAAAEAFLGFIKSYPKSQLRSQAFYNAGINYEKAGKPREALSAYSSVSSSSGTLYENAQKFSAIILENVGLLQRASIDYEELGKKSGDVRQKAKYLSNAAVIKEAFGDTDGMKRIFKALEPIDDPKAVILYDYRLAEVYKRKENSNEELKHLIKFFNASKAEPFLPVKAATRIGDIYKSNAVVDKASYWYRASSMTYDKFKNRGAVKAAGFAAKAKFELSNKVFYDYILIKIPNDPKAQAAAITKKLSLIDTINKKMQEVINFDDGYTIVSALNRLGQAYQHLTYSILNAPLPSGLSDEEKKQVEELLRQKVEPFKDNALSSYRKALEKAEQLETFNEDSLTTILELSKIDSSYSNFRFPYIAGEASMVYDKSLLSKVSIDSTDFSLSEAAVLEQASQRLAADKSDTKALVTLAIYYSLKGLPGVSNIYLDKTKSNFKATADYFNLLAYNNFLEKDYRVAVNNLKAALKIDSSHVASASNLGSYFIKYGGYQRGGGYLARVYPSQDSKVPQNSLADLKNNYALYSVSKEKVDEAIAELKDVVEKDGDNKAAVANLAILFKVVKKVENESNPYLSQYKRLAKTGADFDRIKMMEKY